jgi:hypothetical protein
MTLAAIVTLYILELQMLGMTQASLNFVSWNYFNLSSEIYTIFRWSFFVRNITQNNNTTTVPTYCHDLRVTIDGVWISNRIYIEHLQNVNTNNYDSLTELLTPKITVTTAHIKFSQFAMSSRGVTWWWILTISSVSVLTFLPAGDCQTTNSLFRLPYLHPGTDHIENSVPLLRSRLLGCSRDRYSAIV